MTPAGFMPAVFVAVKPWAPLPATHALRYTVQDSNPRERGPMRQRLYNILESSEYLERPGILYGRLMSVIIILSLVPLMFKEETTFLMVIEWFCVGIFILDYLARWATADLKLKKGALSFLIYPFTPMAIIDAVTILPTFLALNPAWRALRSLRLFRVLRAFKLIRYSKSTQAITRVFIQSKNSLLAVVALAVFYVLVSALIIFKIGRAHD